jgi:hypothetical protein
VDGNIHQWAGDDAGIYMLCIVWGFSLSFFGIKIPWYLKIWGPRNRGGGGGVRCNHDVTTILPRGATCGRAHDCQAEGSRLKSCLRQISTCTLLTCSHGLCVYLGEDSRGRDPGEGVKPGRHLSKGTHMAVNSLPLPT